MPETINTIVQPELYNSILIDHDATQRASLIGLKQNHIPHLWGILEKHMLTELLEPHLLHRHFDLHDGEVLIHRNLHAPGDSQHVPIRIGIAKAMKVGENVSKDLVPLLWMVSTEGNLIAYEFGIKEPSTTANRKVKNISTAAWARFTQEFTSYVRSNNLSDIVSLKDRGSLNGGEYVAPNERALFRVPFDSLNLQSGSHNLESGWVAPKGDPQPSDGHVTKTRQTTGGTVAHYHVAEETGPNAINPAEVAKCYVDAMWAAQKSEAFWMSGLTPLVY